MRTSNNDNVKPTPVNQKKDVQTGSTKKPDFTAQAEWIKPDRPLTRKQEAFVKHLIEHPKDSATKAALATYGKEGKPPTYESANQIASENLQKPQILLELAKYSQTAENTLVDMMDNARKYAKTGDKAGASYASVAVQTANSILDRLHGKATQRTEVKQESVTINLDLSGM